jgi:hypothetical protein
MARAEGFGMYQNDLTMAELISWLDPFFEYRHVPCCEVGEEIEEYLEEQDYLASMLSEEAP